MNRELDSGERIDRYRVDTVLGEGGMARVYRVQHVQLGTWHALKVLHTGWGTAHARLLQEGRVQAQLQHPNIVAVTDVVEVHGAPGLVMEFVAGPTLETLLRRSRLSIEQADVVGRAIIAGVAAAHQVGLIHRDLKPANILLAVQGASVVPKVADFGLAKFLDGPQAGGGGHTRTGVAMGTPSYMSPEQIRDAKNVDRRADIFALGAILYELACGARAFGSDDLLEIFSAVSAGRYLSPTVHAPDLPARMVDAIRGALEPDRERRFPDCEALLAAWSGGVQRADGPVRLDLGSAEPLLDELRSLSNPPSVEPSVPVGAAGTVAPVVAAPRSDATFEPLAADDVPVAPARARAPVMIVGGVLALGAAVGLAGWFGSREEAVPTPVAPVTEPAPTAVVPAVIAAAEAPEVPSEKPAEARTRVPVRPEPAAPPVVAPEPVVEPVVEAPPPPAEVVPTTGTIRVTGDARSVWLQSAAGNFKAGPVAPGTYKIKVFFEGVAPQSVGDVSVGAGEVKTLLCQKALSQCKVQ